MKYPNIKNFKKRKCTQTNTRSVPATAENTSVCTDLETNLARPVHTDVRTQERQSSPFYSNPIHSSTN